MKRLILFLILLTWQCVATAKVTMTLQPTEATLDETIRLILTLDNAQSRALPDLTPLEKNFTILGTQHSLSYHSINGNVQSKTQWIVLLEAKQTGVLPIPTLKVGSEFSEPGQITIHTHSTKNDNQSFANPSPIKLKTNLNNKTPFINEQVLYTVKLYSNQQILEANYQPPQMQDALIIPLGDGKRYQTTYKGQDYAVDEQQYAIYPQKSGKITLTPPSLTALVYDGLPRRVHLKAHPISFSVKPSPSPNWLPAKRIELSQHYDLTTSTLHQGDTIVRTITLEATGVPAQLLPTIPVKGNSKFRVYPEKPSTENKLEQQELIGKSTMNITYVLNESGQITLPAIQLTWFNTQTQQAETTTLPERTFTVHPLQQHKEPLIQQKPNDLDTPTQATNSITTKNSEPLLLWIAILLGVAWSITLVLWWFFKKPKTSKYAKRRHLKDIHFACKKNDPALAKIAVLSWAESLWPDHTFLNINDVVKLITNDPALKKQLQWLSQILYSQNSNHQWNGALLWRSIKNHQASKATRTKKEQKLPPVHPQ